MAYLKEGRRLTAELLETEGFVEDAIEEFKRRGLLLDNQESAFPSEAGAYPASVEERLISHAPRYVIEPWLDGIPHDVSIADQMRDAYTPAPPPAVDSDYQPMASPEPWESWSILPDDEKRRRVDAYRPNGRPLGQPGWTWNEDARDRARELLADQEAGMDVDADGAGQTLWINR